MVDPGVDSFFPKSGSLPNIHDSHDFRSSGTFFEFIIKILTNFSGPGIETTLRISPEGLLSVNRKSSRNSLVLNNDTTLKS